MSARRAVADLLVGEAGSFLPRLRIVRQVVLAKTVATGLKPVGGIRCSLSALLVVVNQVPLTPAPLYAPDANRIRDADVPVRMDRGSQCTTGRATGQMPSGISQWQADGRRRNTVAVV